MVAALDGEGGVNGGAVKDLSLPISSPGQLLKLRNKVPHLPVRPDHTKILDCSATAVLLSSLL